MERYIKYKRFEKEIPFTRNDNFMSVVMTKEDQNTFIQTFFDELITEGWEIISYNEERILEHFKIIVICGKKQESELKQVL